MVEVCGVYLYEARFAQLCEECHAQWAVESEDDFWDSYEEFEEHFMHSAVWSEE